jgi:hypothetical protein
LLLVRACDAIGSKFSNFFRKKIHQGIQALHKQAIQDFNWDVNLKFQAKMQHFLTK